MNNYRTLLTMLSLGLAMLTGPGYAADFYVSPGGQDTNPGTVEKPFASIERARDAVRAAKAKIKDRDIVVRILPGTYYLEKPVVFGLEDSGAGGQRIVYEGEPGNLPVISGGVPVTGWVKAPDDLPFLPEAAKGKVWMAKMGNPPATLKCLYDAEGMLPVAAEEMKYRSRPELKGSFMNSSKYSLDDPVFREFHAEPGQIRDAAAASFMELSICPMRVEEHILVPVKSYDAKTGVVHLRIPASMACHPPESHKKGVAPELRNAIEFLDQPGEWVYRPDQGTIYLWPRKGDAPEGIIRGHLGHIFRVAGISELDGEDQPVRNLTFRNLAFQHTDRMELPEDYKHRTILNFWELSDAPVGAISMRGAQNCLVDACRFEHLGDSGVRLDAYAQGNTIRNSLIRHIGGTGIFIGGFEIGERAVSKNNLILNNLIHNVGQVRYDAMGIWLWETEGNRVEHNTIRDTPYSGMGISGRPLWGVRNSGVYEHQGRRAKRFDEMLHKWIDNNRYQGLFMDDADTAWLEQHYQTKNNRIAYNRFERVKRKLDDANSIYSSALGDGNHIYRNLFLKSDCWSFRTDAFTRRVLVEENVFGDAGGVSSCYNHAYVGNVFLNSLLVSVFYCGNNPPVEGHRIERNVFCAAKGARFPFLVRPLKAESNFKEIEKEHGFSPSQIENWSRFQIDNNLYYAKAGSAFVSPVGQEESFQIDGNQSSTKNGAASPLDGYLNAMRKRGDEKNSIVVADPMFVDPANHDYRVREDSPARKLGITGVDARDFGVTQENPFVKKVK